MRKIALAILIAATPLAAQNWELGLFAGQQSYKSADFPGIGKLEPQSKTVLGARLGYSIVDLGPALFQVTAGFQPKVDTTGKIAGIEIPDKYQHQHMSLGAMFNFKAVVAFGVGLEYRMEKLNVTNSGFGDVSYNRPWLRADAGYAFPSPILKPFIGLELALPLTSKSFDINDSEQDMLKAYAPKMQIGVYAGIRF